MIDDRELLEAVCQKYIRPTEREAKPVVGVELEYPIVNLNGIGLSEVTQPVDFAVVQRLAEEFTVRFGFTDIFREIKKAGPSACSPPAAPWAWAASPMS